MFRSYSENFALQKKFKHENLFNTKYSQTTVDKVYDQQEGTSAPLIKLRAHEPSGLYGL